jgi:hypothetical protein
MGMHYFTGEGENGTRPVERDWLKVASLILLCFSIRER